MHIAANLSDQGQAHDPTHVKSQRDLQYLEEVRLPLHLYRQQANLRPPKYSLPLEQVQLSTYLKHL